ncbi:MAG: zeta toxin family protein, partial [Erysipelotrichaceae bacterium]|nr:zeta toxin family protein [Erysipelotrichaceae bacterium]
MLKHKPVVIGIAGGTCSGKTSIAGILIDEFRYTNSINIIREDDYYKDQSHLPMEERAKTNYDHP